MSSACRNRSDRDAPSNAKPEGVIPQHSRDLEGDIRRPYEQPWQRDLRLRRRDDWYSDESDQESVSGAVRSGNRDPRYYRDGEIPVSRTEIVSSRQPHGEPEITDSRDHPVKITLHGRSTCDLQRDLEDESEPEVFTTDVQHHGDKKIEHDQFSLSYTRVRNSTANAQQEMDANQLFSTSGASQRGAEVRMNSTNNEQRKHRDAADRPFSTTGAGNVGLEKNGQASQSVVTLQFSTRLTLSVAAMPRCQDSCAG